MISLEHIDKVFYPGSVNENVLFSDFNFSFPKGEFVSVVGSNGSGKTTMLNLIAGSLPVEGGKIFLDGEDITRVPEYRRARRIGRVFQNPAFGTVPDMTVEENLALAENKGKHYRLSFALQPKRRAAYREMVRELGLGLEDKMQSPVGNLSGGQRQALSLIMTTLTPLDLLLLDEHTAALDPKTAEIIMQITDRVVREKHLSALMVTHNLRYAVEYGDRLLMMDKGKIIINSAGEEKKKLRVEDILDRFNAISIECGN